MVVPADVIAIAPEFGPLTQQDVNTGEIQNAINDALLELAPDAWGTKYDLATKLLAAHKLGVAHPALCQISPRTYQTPGAADAGELGVTRYGMELSRLKRQLPRIIVG